MALSASTSVQAPPKGWNLNGVFFDAWLNLHHNNSLTITQHPVETRAFISDHAFINPRKFSFEIGVTNCLTGGGFTGPNRNVNAYQSLVAMMGTRDLLKLSTKYGDYENVLIESIDVPDNYQSQQTLKATVNLVEVILATSELIKVSANPNATDSSNRGQVSPVPALGTLDRISFDTNRLRGLFR